MDSGSVFCYLILVSILIRALIYSLKRRDKNFSKVGPLNMLSEA